MRWQHRLGWSAKGNGLDEAVAYFLELRIRVRGNPRATELVDRCLEMIARAATADAAAMTVLEAEVEILRAELEARFGPAREIVWH